MKAISAFLILFTAFYSMNANASQEKMKKEVDCLAKNIYYEAESEPMVGKIAVAQVTMNRVKSDQYPKTVCGVVKEKHKYTCQFSWVCKDKKRITNQKCWQESNKIARNILIFHKKYNIIGNATFYHANYVRPNWSHKKKFVKKVGNHLFYREV